MSEKSAAWWLSALLALLLLLSGCRTAPEPSQAPASAPSPSADVTAAPEPAGEPKELWGFPIDDTHDAFKVPTGGKLGTVLVTAEESLDEEFEFLPPLTLSVWTKDDLETPLQSFELWGATLGGTVLDADFDGYMDFYYTWFQAVASNTNFSLYTWNEEEGKFASVGDFHGSGFSVDEEEQSLRTHVHYTGYSGADEAYRWENGELVCFRRGTYEALEDNPEHIEYVTCELVNGQWQEISRGIY